MKKLLFPLCLLLGLAAAAQINNQQNLTDNNDPLQVASNNLGNTDNVNVNLNVNAENNPPVQQVQVQQQVQQFNPYRGNVFNTNPDRNTNNQQKYGQSIQISSGGGGGSYSGSSGKAAKAKTKGSTAYKIKKAMDKMKSGYKARKHYSHKSRVRKCHKF